MNDHDRGHIEKKQIISLFLPAYLPLSYREQGLCSHQKFSTYFLEIFMKLTKKEIKRIELVSIELKKWVDNQSYNLPSVTKVQLMPSSRYKKVTLLLCAKVEKDFAELDQLHQEYESWRAKTLTEDNEEEFTILVDSLKGTLYGLSDTLNQIAEEAIKERKRRIVKQIFYVTITVVGFLAALFTIFHYLGVLLSQLGGPADSNVN